MKLVMNLSLHKAPRHAGRLKKQIWAGKSAVGAWVTCGKTPTTVN